MTINRRSALGLMGGGVALAGCQATTGTAQRFSFPTNYFSTTENRYPQFAVVPEYPKFGFDFSSWDKVTRAIVMDFGPSDRISRARPPAEIGTRFPRGHQSPYRAEGNRIPFSRLGKEAIPVFQQSREILVDLGNQAPISQFSWSDQLAYWFNLHNAIMIEQLAIRYPSPFPEKLLVGPNAEPLHTAKLVTIQDTPLSLLDIRTEIVYRNWKHPGVIYGFFHGDVGGPGIRQGAYTGPGVSRQLARTAGEFINSLRGVRDLGSFIGVSRLYEETKPLFPNWPTDLRAHLSSFAEDEVYEVLQSGKALQIRQYDNRIADLAGGAGAITTASRTPVTGNFADASLENRDKQVGGAGATLLANIDKMMGQANVGLPSHAMRTLTDRNNKYKTLRARGRGRRKGTVIIEDLPSRPVN